jgi:hypothetical protein|tara:strand:+ start:623 stop:1258 length:636 start_codon:yes stop_codon:yes gene_type:complete
MKKRLDKRGYFFLIDSILALGVLAVGAFLIFTFYVSVPSKEEPSILSDDLMDFFANNKIKDVNNEYVSLGGTLWETEGQPGGICNGEELTVNGETTLLQQVAIFYEKSQGDTGNSCYFDPDNEDLIERFIGSLVTNTLPLQYKFEFVLKDQLLGDQLLYPIYATPQGQKDHLDSKNAANVLIPSKKIVYGILDEQTGDMFGPYTAEVLVWQ